MKGLAQAAMQEPEEAQEEANGMNLDMDIGYGLLVSAMLEPDGMQALQQAMAQQNPVPLVAGIISTIIKETAQRLEGTEVDIDRNVWLQEGGVVDRTLDMLADTLKIDDQMQGAILSDVVDQMKLYSKQNKQRQQQPAQEEQMPPQGLAGAAQAGPMPMGGV